MIQVLFFSDGNILKYRVQYVDFGNVDLINCLGPDAKNVAIPCTFLLGGNFIVILNQMTSDQSQMESSNIVILVINSKWVQLDLGMVIGMWTAEYYAGWTKKLFSKSF